MTDTIQSLDTRFVPYWDNLEQPRPDEDQLVKQIADKLAGNNRWAFKKYRHGIRDAHAKSHGILRGELTIYPNLPEPYRQGLFATPGPYPVIARLSSTSGALRSDETRGIRGLGIKVLGVEGKRSLSEDTATTQDFILVTHREFPFPDAQAYLKRGMPFAVLLARLPDSVLKFVGHTLGAVRPILEFFGGSLPATLDLFSHPNTHILGMTFFSSAPLRHGNYVAKLLLAPLSENVKAFIDQPVPAGAGKEAFRDMVVDFFANNSAEYELRVQLCTNPVTMPIEDATVSWPEEESPHVGVAKITFGVQNPATDARRAFGDDVLSFNSWRGLAAHRPLGSINRLKKLVYEASSDFRHRVNNVARVEPTKITELPD
ncbi:catalase family protein [Mycobacterium sp.]|uniref:catalase family protein n=1 Tax=Mycobacterium sp. TaxID=1785 RepID=UPI002B802C7F|nr:catalase family protein [Mycobacterium sp.]HKP40050.1 catalase family protein [Mycobacterium sp.]